MLRGQKPQQSLFGEQLLCLLLQHLGASQDVNSGLSPWQRTEDCIVNRTRVLDTFALVPGRGVAAGQVKALLPRNPTCKGTDKIWSMCNFHIDHPLARQPHSENALGGGTGEKKSQLAEGKLS